MDTFDAIYQRRAIKHFDPNHTLSKEEETKLLEAAIQSPTSFNIQHWRFVVVRDPQLRQKLRTEFGNDQAQMTDASLLILMTADTKAWTKDPGRYWKNAPKEVADLLVGWMAPFHEGREGLQRDEAQRSIGMAMQTLMLSISFTLAGLFVLFSTTSNARLDRRDQTITLPGDNRTLAFNEVESVQLNQVLTTGERSFVNSQIQLNLRNGESLSLLSHGGKEQIYVDLIRTALFLDKPAVIPEA